MMVNQRYRAIVLSLAVLSGALLTEGCGYLLPRQVAEGPTLVDNVVLFRYYAPNARRVQLGGDWPSNNWTARRLPVSR